jgi:hypothetical protein
MKQIAVRRVVGRPTRARGRIQDDVFDRPPLPGVGDVDKAVPRLDDRRVGELGALLLLEGQGPLPPRPILGQRDGQDAAAFRHRIVDEDVPAVP